MNASHLFFRRATRVSCITILIGMLCLASIANGDSVNPPQAAASSSDPKLRQVAKASASTNVLIITVDTLRADMMGAYSNRRSTSPRIEAWTKTATVFERGYSHTSWTLPAMASMLTSLNTSAHRCWEARDKLASSYTTLPERLQQAGYHTAALSTSLFFTRNFGLHQGFETFDFVEPEYVDDSSHMKTRMLHGITSHRLTAKGIEWLGRHDSDDRPWLLWLHYLDPHDAYVTHSENSKRFQSTLSVDRYQGEIYFTDRWIGTLLDALDELKLADSTIVVLTSDHGEEFMEHGQTGHGLTLFEEVLHVPLIIKGPNLAPRRVTTNVSTIDVMPTILDLLELPSAPNIDGRSLAPAMRGRKLKAKPLLFEMRGGAGSRIRALRSSRFKLVVGTDGRRARLYDLASDPAEKIHRRSEKRTIAIMEQKLRDLVQISEKKGRSHSQPERAQLSAETIESLRALGYVVDAE